MASRTQSSGSLLAPLTAGLLAAFPAAEAAVLAAWADIFEGDCGVDGSIGLTEVDMMSE